MKHTTVLSISAFLLLSLAACNGLTPDFQATLTTQAGGIYPTIAARLSETPRSGTSAQNGAQASTPMPTLTAPVAVNIPTETIPCDRAAGGTPIDITIPDGSVLQPGEDFTKTWRLMNTGSCAWTENYAVVWFSGDDLGDVHERLLKTRVEPGQAIDLSVDMQAPVDARSYYSYWKLRNEAGQMFGLGPGGESPFWVMIEVLPVSTLTPAGLPTAEATPATFSSGVVALLVGEGLDLDAATKSADETADLGLNGEPDAALAPLNGSALNVYGDRLPLVEDCLPTVDTLPLPVASLMEGQYLCYISNEGYPGYVRLLSTGTDGEVILEFHTWATP